MLSKSQILKPLAAAALLALAGSSHAVITVYATAASFAAATTAPGTDTYTGFSIIGVTPSPVVRSAGVYGYTATTPGNFFGGGTGANPFLSTNTATDTITFNTFTGGAKAIGGLFFGSDIGGNFLAGNITLTATDASGSITQTITGATQTSFLGFVSTTGVTSMTLAAVQGASPIWPSADNLVMAVVAVPEPGTVALMLAGLGMVGFMARRRA
jgi:hypothetical protein